MVRTKINKTHRIKILFATIVVICALVLTFMWFSNRLHTIISNTSNSFLMETSNHQAVLFNTKLNDQLTVLQSLAKQFSSVDFNNYTELKNTVLSLQDDNFKQLTVADSSGACIANNNKYSANISKKHYFQAAFKGEPTVSNGIDVDTLGEDILALSVPIYQKNKIVGVLTGTYDRSVLDSLFSTTMFNGEGYTYIIDSGGEIIAKADNVNSLVKSSNYLDFIKNVNIFSDTAYDDIAQDFTQGSANTIHYKSGSQERYVAYYPIGLHDWYVVSEITNDVILSQTQDLSFITTILVSVLAVILFGIFIVILSTIQKAESIMIKNERFKLINAQNQSVIFDYDINKKILDLSGDTAFIFGADYPATAPVNLEFLFENIHPDDVSTFDKFIHTFDNSETNHSFEFRFKCEDDNYYWFRLSSTLVKEGPKPLKLIGNLINVETQKTQELSLKQEAEQDSLTGLLNKKAMANYVESFLKTQNSDAIHALFIIDLDNFKNVNDTLGHIFGDQVLLETASKITRVFSERDFIGRIGGDEFAAFLNLSAFDSKENAKRIINQKGTALTKALHETYKGQGSQEVTVSASIGIALYNEHGNNYLTLYNNADKALYSCKKNGKNGYDFYNKED